MEIINTQISKNSLIKKACTNSCLDVQSFYVIFEQHMNKPLHYLSKAI